MTIAGREEVEKGRTERDSTFVCFLDTLEVGSKHELLRVDRSLPQSSRFFTAVVDFDYREQLCFCYVHLYREEET